MNFLAERLRTSNVCDIITGMSASRDWTPTPSLVDALREEGASESEVGDVLLWCVSAGRSHDTPRLVYADFLEEQGEAERAAFVRVQCELARMPPKPPCTAPDHVACTNPSCVEWRQLTSEPRQRERDLWKPPLNREWVKLLDIGTLVITSESYPASCNSVGLVHRGFVQRFWGTWQEWLRLHERLYWNAKQTTSCPHCGGLGGKDDGYGKNSWVPCQTCFKTPGRIPRPPVIEVPCLHCNGCGAMGRDADGSEIDCSECSGGTISQSIWATCQPGLERVELTTFPGSVEFHLGIIDAWFIAPTGERFDRVKCSTCDGHEHYGHCKQYGQLVNEWTCEEKWPGLRFAMPQAEPWNGNDMGSGT